MNAFQTIVKCSICGGTAVAAVWGPNLLEKYTHVDPRACKRHLDETYAALFAEKDAER